MFGFGEILIFFLKYYIITFVLLSCMFGFGEILFADLMRWKIDTSGTCKNTINEKKVILLHFNQNEEEVQIINSTGS